MLVSYTNPNYTLPSAFDWVFTPPKAARPESRLEVTDDGYVLKLDVPGVTADGLELEVVEQTLKLRTKRSDGGSGESAAYSWKLPKTADAEQISAVLSYGVLTLKVGKKASASPRRIVVEESSALT